MQLIQMLNARKMMYAAVVCGLAVFIGTSEAGAGQFCEVDELDLRNIEAQAYDAGPDGASHRDVRHATADYFLEGDEKLGDLHMCREVWPGEMLATISYHVFPDGTLITRSV